MTDKLTKSAKKRARAVTKTDKILKEIQSLKTAEKIPKMNPLEVYQATQVGDDQSSAILRVMDGIEKKTNGNVQRMRESAGLKLIDGYSVQILNKHYARLTVDEKKKLLEYILVDDLGQVASQVLKHASPIVLNYLWGKIKDTSLVHKARNVLRDYFGIDTNDDVPLANNRFSIQPHQGSWQQPADVSYRYDAVCAQSIASMLMPEFTQSRIPSDVALKTGLVNKTQSFTLSTNASGSAAVVFYPQNFDTTSFYRIFNDNTFSPVSGNQTPTSTLTSGPLSALSTTVSTDRLTAFAVCLEPIVSTLNNSGRVIYCMNDFSSVTQAVTSIPFNTTTCRDAQYCLYGSVAGASGHRLVYDNSSVADESFQNFGSIRDQDAMMILVEGAQASTAIFQITFTYQVEYTINGGASLLIEKQPPPLGPASVKAYDAAISMRPDLRIIGRQEAAQLYSQLVDCSPYYSDVLKLLTGFSFKHTYQDVLISKGISNDLSVSSIAQQPSIFSDGDYTLASS